MCLKCFNFNSNLGLDDNGKKFALSGSTFHYTPDKIVQVQHIFLDLKFDLENCFYGGSATLTLCVIESEIQTLYIDAANLDISKIRIANAELKFEIEATRILIYLDRSYKSTEEIRLEIFYSKINSNRGIYFVKPDFNQPDKVYQAWTQGETEHAKYWFPCLDYASQLCTTETRIKAKSEYKIISNGLEIEHQIDGDYQISHWKMDKPHPPYLVAIAVGEFEEILDEDNVGGIPLSYYAQKSKMHMIMPSAGKTPQMMAFLQEKFRYKYPWGKYAQVWVDDFRFGGMENTSCTFMADDVMADEKAKFEFQYGETVVVHELAHHWFGDLIVAKHWSHAWIKEGMASYSEVLWTDNEYGKQDAAYYMLNEARSYLAEDTSRYRRPMVTHVYREAIELYDRHLYEKGACVYHMIRAELGDELFYKAIHTFVRDNAHQTVETIDLLRAIEKATGRNLMFLFDQYVYRGGHPDYKVAYAWDGDNKLAKVTVTQTQVKDSKNDNGNSKDVFDLRIPIGFGYKPEKDADDSSANLKTFTVRVYEREQSFYFPLEEKPAFISFDVGNKYLKTVVLEYAVAELKAQLQFDPDPVSRIYAAQALAKKGGLEAVKTLSEVLKKEPFWAVRAEVAGQLVDIKLDQAFDGLVAGLKDKDARVRRAVVNALGKIKTHETYKALRSIVEKGDASYYVEAAAASAMGSIAGANPDEKPTDEQVLKELKLVLKERQGWNEVVRSGAISGLAQMKTSEDALDLILKYTAIGTPQALRLGAIRALGTISTGQTKINLERILQRLAELSKETFFLTQVSVVAALGQMETRKAMRILRSLANQTPDGRVRRMADEAVQRVQKNAGSDAAVKQLREELDEVKKDNQDLKSRLESLEAKSKKD